jgi:hypothetical protein
MPDLPAPMPMVADGLAVIPLQVPDGLVPAGIDGNLAHFAPATGDGPERRYELPVYEGAPARLAHLDLELPTGEYARLPCIQPHPEGTHRLELGISGGLGRWWVTVFARKGTP